MHFVRRLSGKAVVRDAVIALAACWGIAAASGTASAQTSTAVISDSFSGGLWTYDLSLTNSSPTATVGTFWYAWIPGQDYLTTMPTNVTSPPGWTNDQITHAGSGDGYAPRWVANSSATYLQPDSTLSGFSFTSPDTPSQIFGPSAFYGGPPTSTFFTYTAGPFSAGGVQSVATEVPEPTSLALVAPAALLLKRRRNRTA